MTVQLTARNATAADLVAILNEQNAHKLDVVVPASHITSRNGLLAVAGTEPELTSAGVTLTEGTYRPTAVFDDGLCDKLGIPRKFLNRLRQERPDILDGVVNGFLHGADGYPGDGRAFLLRLFAGQDGIARAMLSDRYALSMDNLDVLTAVLRGIRDGGVNVTTRVSDLSESGMRVQFEAPDIAMTAPRLLAGYRSPFSQGLVRAGDLTGLRQAYGEHHLFGTDAPVVFAGFDLRNNETGGGAYTLTPKVIVLACTNGLTIKKEGIRKVHLGATLAQGTVRPSLDTLRTAGELISAQTRDAVRQWLTTDYLARLVAGLEEKAGTPVTSPAETVPAICAGLGMTQDEQKAILDAFILGSQWTAGGVAQAVSAYAQTVAEPDRAYAVELLAVDAMEAAAQ
jgi:hypothetical protein